MTHLVTPSAADLEGCVLGCYDHDPIASFLPFPIHMIRQNSEMLVARAFDLLDHAVDGPELIEIAPELVPPRTIRANTLFDLG